MVKRFSIVKAFLLSVFVMAGASGQFWGSPKRVGRVVVAPVAAVVVQPTLTRSEALAKHAACMAADPERMVNLQVARQVKGRLAAEGFNVDAGIFCNETKGGAGLAGFVPEADLVRDGFPDDEPALLIIRDTDGDGHSVEQLRRWVTSGLWNWGLRWCLQRVW